MVIKVKFDELPMSRNDTPIFDYCRRLIKQGCDPKTRLEVYRNNESWDVAINVGEGAELSVRHEPSLQLVKYRPFIKNKT